MNFLMSFPLQKLSWFRLTSLITLVLLMWKWIGLFLRKNHLLKCWDWFSLLNWIGALTLSLLLKLLPRKLELWFVLWSFFFLRFLYISINLPYGHAWMGNSKHFLPPVNGGKKLNLELSFKTKPHMWYFLVLISI